MNDYTSPGNYLSPTGSVTNSLLNCPHTGSSFIMHVERVASTSGYIKQRIICNDSKPIEYWRNQTNGIFRNWDKSILNSDLDAIYDDIKLYKINRSSFASVLQNRANKATFLSFVQPTDNPFSFSSGYVIAFNSSLVQSSADFMLMGTNGITFEVKILTIN